MVRARADGNTMCVCMHLIMRVSCMQGLNKTVIYLFLCYIIIYVLYMCVYCVCINWNFNS